MPSFPRDPRLKRLRRRFHALGAWLRRAKKRGATKKRLRDHRAERRHTAAQIRQRKQALTRPKPRGGVVTYDGKSVAAWIVPTLQAARRSGMWRGRVNSGYRSISQQWYLWNNASRLGLIHYVSVAYPGTSNHNFYRYPRGAVDVSHWQGLHAYIHTHRTPLRSYVDVFGYRDVVQFSATGR